MKRNHTGRIILRNVLTIFNFVNLILAVMILLVGSYKNLLFILIAIANTLISTINELRAERIVNKMKLLSEQNPTVLKNGKPIQVAPESLALGDIILLGLGDQIPVDCKIKQGTIEVNESLITGEQDNIARHLGDKLTSGSFVVSGSCQAEVTATKSDSFISKLESSARTIKTTNSKLFNILNKIVKYISFALIPVGILLFLARLRVPGTTIEVAVTSTVAGLINMIPEGLVLLTSSVLALTTVRLSKKKILVQDLYSIETLARVDCICLDKTGTLTTGKMTVKDLLPAKNSTKTALEDALRVILAHSETTNATSTALRNKLLKSTKNLPTAPILEVIPFSSDRKHSGVRTKDAEYLMGAVEFITKNPDFIKESQSLAGNYRVISVIKKQKTKEILLGFALLEDELRKDAKNIINFFIENNVEINIISGDNLRTVKTIATEVGVPNPRAVDLSATKTPINYKNLVNEYNIFTRVTPEQKKRLILALKEQGKTVAMTGDGVNDILAMKEADCSIAIGEGADAARRSAKIVLLGSDFATVPDVIAEGRQSINNLERSATLFLTKTVYATILAVLFTIIPIEYPFSPVSMSLLNFLCIGFPGLILALEKNTARIKNQFVNNIKRFSIPTGIIISIAALATSVIAKINGFSRPLLITVSTTVVFILDYILLCRISKPLTKLRAALLAVILALFLAALFIPFSRNFFDFHHFF